MSTAEDIEKFSWMLDGLVKGTEGIVGAIAVSSDGFMLACSEALPEETADQFAAIVSGLNSLTKGAAACFGNSSVEQIIVEMDRHFAIVSRMNTASVIAVVADRTGSLGTIGHEMRGFVQRSGELLSPEVITEMKNALVR